MEHIIDKQQIEALKGLADLNIRVSDMRNTLSTLEKEEETFLLSREKKELKRIEALLEDSKDILSQTQTNFQEAKEFQSSVIALSDYLKEAHDKFQGIVALYEEKSSEWDKEIEAQEMEVSKIKQELRVERIKIESENKAIISAKKVLEEGNRKLESDRGTLARAIERLKAKRI